MPNVIAVCVSSPWGGGAAMVAFPRAGHKSGGAVGFVRSDFRVLVPKFRNQLSHLCIPVVEQSLHVISNSIRIRRPIHVIVPALLVVHLLFLDEARLQQSLDGPIRCRAFPVDRLGDIVYCHRFFHVREDEKNLLVEFFEAMHAFEEPLTLHVLGKILAHRF